MPCRRRADQVADTGDRWGADKAVVLLTWQDGLRRVGMVVGPPIGALAVAAGLMHQLLWLEAATVLAAGLLACSVKGERAAGVTVAPPIRSGLLGRRDVLYGWIARGTGCLTWGSRLFLRSSRGRRPAASGEPCCLVRA
jgi:hypothetical protein